VVSRYLDVSSSGRLVQSVVEAFARYSTSHHQRLTDLLHPARSWVTSLRYVKKKGRLEGLRIAYVGDGNNIAQHLGRGGARLPIILTLACPAV